tara:strand:- start:1583 stop:3184 length:1602 start_codon:yes stop_codon:yes gene_type:complete
MSSTSELIQPIAQTFRVNQVSGIYITKIGIYFATKAADADYPVQLSIRPTVNGVPDSSKIIENSVSFKAASDITVSATAATETTFTFEEPVYLEGGKDFAICIQSNALGNAYQVWTAKLGDFKLGSTTERLQTDPYAGIFFKSANGRVFEADQTRDLTFKVYRANFTGTNALVRFNAAPPPVKSLTSNPFLFAASDATVTVAHPNHGFQVNDVVHISSDSSGLDSATSINGVLGASILGSRAVTHIDGTGYKFEMDSSADSAIFGGGNSILATQQYIIDSFKPNIEILQPNGTNHRMVAGLTTSKSFGGGETAYGTLPKHATANKMDTFLNSPAVIATAVRDTALTRSSYTIDLELVTTSSYAAPSVDLQRASVISVHNIIDNPDSAATTGFNVPLSYVAETVANFGSTLAKHISIPVLLAEPATGIKVLVDVNRPQGTDFDLFYKVLDAGGDVSIEDTAWIEASKVEPDSNHNTLPIDTNYNVFREYKYVIGGTYQGDLAPFTTYQIKIVMRSTSSTDVPRFKALRTIALGT